MSKLCRTLHTLKRNPHLINIFERDLQLEKKVIVSFSFGVSRKWNAYSSFDSSFRFLVWFQWPILSCIFFLALYFLNPNRSLWSFKREKPPGCLACGWIGAGRSLKFLPPLGHGPLRLKACIVEKILAFGLFIVNFWASKSRSWLNQYWTNKLKAFWKFLDLTCVIGPKRTWLFFPNSPNSSSLWILDYSWSWNELRNKLGSKHFIFLVSNSWESELGEKSTFP